MHDFFPLIHTDMVSSFILNIGLQEYHRLPLTCRMGLIKLNVTLGYSKCLQGCLILRVNFSYLSL